MVNNISALRTMDWNLCTIDLFPLSVILSLTPPPNAHLAVVPGNAARGSTAVLFKSYPPLSRITDNR